MYNVESKCFLCKCMVASEHVNIVCYACVMLMYSVRPYLVSAVSSAYMPEVRFYGIYIKNSMSVM